MYKIFIESTKIKVAQLKPLCIPLANGDVDGFVFQGLYEKKAEFEFL